MGDKISLNKKRAEKVGDSTLWSPIEMLEDAAEQIRSEIAAPKRAIVIFMSDEGDRTNISWMASKCTWQDIIIVLQLMMKRVLDAWTST